MSARAPTGNPITAHHGPCPRCRNRVEALQDANGEFNCRICGGPVIVSDDLRVPRSGKEIPTLDRIRRNRVRSKLYRAGSVVLAAASAVGAFFLAGLLLLISPAASVSVSLAIAMTAPFILSFLAWRHASALKAGTHDDYQAALQDVAEEIVRGAPAPISGAEVGRILAMTEAQTDALLARLNTLDSVESHITDDGELVFVARSDPKFRVDSGELDAELEEAVLPENARSRRTH